MSSSYTIDHVIPATVEMTEEQAIGLIKAVVFCFGTQSFNLTGVLAHRSVISLDDISSFVFDELAAGVKVALSMAVKPRVTRVSTAVLHHEVRQVIGDLRGPIWFKIGRGSYQKFDPSTPL